MLYSSKSGAKKIFMDCDIPIPPGSYDIKNEKEFILTLTKLIAYNLDVQKWVFKIDNEFGSRGIAYLNVDAIKPISDLRRREKNKGATQEVVAKIYEIITSIV